MSKSTIFATLFLCLTLRFAPAEEQIYNPLAVAEKGSAQTLDLKVEDQQRHRNIPVLIYLPEVKTPSAVILFSHGLGGSRENNPYLGQHWSARGYVVVFMQHEGSDESIWKDVPRFKRMASIKKGMGLENALLRFKDVPAVIDQLERWNTSPQSPLFGRMDLKRIGMSGHSFGAVTTQAVSGQRWDRADANFTDDRIKAALAMSPSCPKNAKDLKVVFGGIEIPWLLMTGTEDLAKVAHITMEERLAVYPALPPGGKYELVLFGAEHAAFGEGDRLLSHARNANHHRVILALSTAFWDAWLRQDPQAKNWLEGEGPSTVLEKKDRWQMK